MTWLASCGQVDYRTHLEIYCPKMKNYTKDSIDKLTKDTHKKMKKVYEELELAIQ